MNKQEFDAILGAESKQSVILEKLYRFIKTLVKENNINLTEKQIVELNNLMTAHYICSEHRDEMAESNSSFFNRVYDDTDKELLY